MFWHPAQFLIIPFRRWVQTDTNNVSKAIIKRLNLKMKPWSRPTHANRHDDRRPLQQELPMDSIPRTLYEKFMANENRRLVRTLANAQSKGMELQGYTGKLGDTTDIWNWLRQNW